MADASDVSVDSSAVKVADEGQVLTAPTAANEASDAGQRTVENSKDKSSLSEGSMSASPTDGLEAGFYKVNMGVAVVCISVI